MAGQRRSIVREHEFEEQLDALICNAEEADENPELLSKYHDDILYYQTTLNNLTNIIASQKSSADSLIRLIKKKYRIKE